jgi:hypothetical protein
MKTAETGSRSSNAKLRSGKRKSDFVGAIQRGSSRQTALTQGRLETRRRDQSRGPNAAVRIVVAMIVMSFTLL